MTNIHLKGNCRICGTPAKGFATYKVVSVLCCSACYDEAFQLAADAVAQYDEERQPEAPLDPA